MSSGLRRAGVREHAVYLGYAAGWRLVRLLPERAAYRLGTVAADLAWWQRGAGVRRLEANLSRVVRLGEAPAAAGAGPDAGPDATGLRRLARDGMRSYLRYWCDLFRLADWDRGRIVGTVTPIGEQHLREAMVAGRGFVAALPHLGNWDHAGAWAALTGTPVTTVAERVRPERLYRRFVAVREALGIEVLPLTGDRDVLATLADRLRAGRLVCLLADRDLRSSGVEVTFFGAPVRMPPGPALLALRTGAPLHPVTTAYDRRDGVPGGGRAGGHGIVLTIHPEVPAPRTGTTRERVTAMTQQVAEVFERAVAATPQDWHLLQPLWLDDLTASTGELPPQQARTPLDAAARIPNVVDAAAGGGQGGR